MRTKRLTTRKAQLLLIVTLTLVLFEIEKAGAADPIRCVPVDNHHVIGINSDQPYVAGFHVLTDDFRTYRMIDGAAATIAFPSTNASSFPSSSWIGAGLFLQAQDHHYLFIDYGFYMMVALESSGNLFIDVGLHQTREGSLPIQQPGSRLVYAFTWQLFEVEPATRITLTAQWHPEGLLHYSIVAGQTSLPLMSLNVSELPDCEHIMPAFYTGNVIGQQFPLGRYVDFFQFGVTGSEIISNNQWKVLIEEPEFLKQNAWAHLGKAWSIQGDISYLDQDARWGGAPYIGVDVQRPAASQQDFHALVFSYESRTLKPGTVLWDETQMESNEGSALDSTDYFWNFSTQATSWSVLFILIALSFLFHYSGKESWMHVKHSGVSSLSGEAMKETSRNISC